MKPSYVCCLMGMAGAGLLGCAGSGPQQWPIREITEPYDLDEAQRLIQERGSNRVIGNAFMRQKGGGVVTCAGQDVYLLPATPYTTRRIQHLYGNDTAGANHERRAYRFVPDPQGYFTTARLSKCNSQGNFTFERVMDGTFYLTTLVSWQVGYATQGGYLMHRVTVMGGQTAEAILSP